MISKQSILANYITLLQNIQQEQDYEYFFRGHSNRVTQILPRIYRKKESADLVPRRIDNEKEEFGVFLNYIDKTLIENEDRIFKEIILRSPKDFVNEHTAIEKLVKMQHYGLPTRLIDITSNPLVALYFACLELENYPYPVMIDPESHGEIVILKIHKDEIKFYDSDTVSILANIPKMRSFTLPEWFFDLKRNDINNSPQNLPSGAYVSPHSHPKQASLYHRL